jgi:bifunctional non-homologous end joining protein LigD
MRQEFVVAGFVPSKAHARAIGSLVLGYYEDCKLMHAGRVGTGFTEQVALELFERLSAMEITSSPFAKRLALIDARDVRFVRPELVAEVAFRGWSSDGLVRHASFQGLRADKRPSEVIRED